MNKNNRQYTQEETVAYALWATDNMLNNSSITSNVRKEVLEQFKKEILAVIDYDKEGNVLSITEKIENR